MNATSRLGLTLILIATAGCSYGPLAEINPVIIEIEQRIEGRENEPAEEVFQNIQIFRGMPAQRVLHMMTESFSPALGVSCGHCHVSGQWHLDDKEPKRIAREMWRMTGDINQRVQTIVEPEARVHCATCHQGRTEPPLEVIH
ncbi:MAG TPA: photosynthetic reaction center cytochrome c subunit family protein [Thermoanaerobaculia bacterium]|nr:photosynthetic reaction center cytochrome c subunit family protein [Thermoanaerobaculia bacterium]